MKKYAYKLSIMMLLLTIPLLAKSITNNNTERPPLGVFVNGKHFDVSLDSIEISAKGLLMINADQKNTIDNKPLTFRIVIRHINYVAGLVITTIEERYEDGAVKESIPIEKILAKCKVGDQILLIPVDNTKLENTKEPIVMTVKVGDHC